MKTRVIQMTVALAISLAIAVTPAIGKSKDKKKKKDEDKNNPTLIGKREINKGQLSFYSLDKEVALGRQLAAEVDRSSKFITDPAITEYVNRVGQNLVLHSDAKVPFTIKVIDSTEVNAFALPGGFLYVNRGLLEAADTEAEVAGVLSHEIAHVTARHGIEQASKGQLINYASLPLIFLGGIGSVIQQVASIAVPLTFLKFSRNAEKEADRLGSQYMWASGYDPNALVSFFEKLQSKEKAKPGTLSKLFSTHPLTGDRITEVRETIAAFPDRNEYQITTSEFNLMKSRLNAVNASAGRAIGTSGDSRPTLKRRPQTDADGTTASADSSSEEKERPVLKRKDGTPAGDEAGKPAEASESKQPASKPVEAPESKQPAPKPAAKPASNAGALPPEEPVEPIKP